MEMRGNVYWQVQFDDRRGVLILRRTAEPFANLEVIDSAHEEIAKAVRAAPAGFRRRALLDFRNGPPGRNDQGFERATEGVRRSLGQVFERVAVLVRTAAGRLQVTRLQKSEGGDDEQRAVFTDEEAAIAWLSR